MGVLSSGGEPSSPTRRLIVDLLIFNGCAFALTWLVVGLCIWTAEASPGLLGALRLGAPAFYLAVYAPSLGAVVVTFARYGRARRAGLFRSLFRVRAGWVWIALAFLAFPALWLVV